jgi:D-hydroxyproline dehydrogenase subunit beta
VTAQAGPALAYARRARSDWLRLGPRAGFWVAETGTVVAARAEDELAVVREFAARAPLPVTVLDADGVRARAPLGARDLVGGAFLAGDVRVNPREAIPAIAAWLAGQGVRFLWRTCAAGVADRLLLTSRGPVEAGRIVIAVGHDLDRLLPEPAEQAGLRRCALHMLRVDSPGGRRFTPAVLTGLSLLRYAGFAACPSVPALRDRFAAAAPRLLQADVNLMFTQWPDGALTIGDTHSTALTHPPFRDESVDDLLLAETARLLGVDTLTVRERWRGVYAKGADDFLVEHPAPGVTAVAVTTGIGMTTAFGLAYDVVAALA